MNMKPEDKKLVAEALLEAAKAVTTSLTDLSEDNWLVVYHGTSLSEVPSLINGFDATRLKYRLYGGPKHRGLFVTPDFKTAERFAPYGEVVLELLVRAKNLHGTDYSGRTGRQQKQEKRTEEWLAGKFPNSFRPYLSLTLTQAAEPQALLIGLVSPKQILRVWHKGLSSDAGKWYTRSEFLALGLEAGPSAEESVTKKVEDLGIDLSSPRLSLDEFLDATARLADVPRSRVESALSVRAPKGEDEIVRLIERFGFQPTAARAFARKFMKSLTNKQVAKALLAVADKLEAASSPMEEDAVASKIEANASPSLLKKIDDLKLIEYDPKYKETYVEPPRIDMYREQLPEEVDYASTTVGNNNYAKIVDTRSVPLNSIIVYQDLLNKENLQAIAQEGAIQKPVDVVKYNDKMYLIDGNHRYAVALLRGDNSILANIRQPARTQGHVTASGLTAYLHPEVQKLRRHIAPKKSLIVHAPEGKEVADRLPDLFGYWLAHHADRYALSSAIAVQHAKFWEWLTDSDNWYQRDEAFAAVGISEEDLPSIRYMEQYPREPIVKNEWLVHFTKDALSIAQQGFIKGIPDYDKLGLTTQLPEEMKEKGGFNFAYRTKDDRFISVAQRGWHGWRFGEEVVVFRANGYAVWHRTDEQQEVVFWGKTAHDIVPVRLQPDGWTVLSKSGAKVFSSRDTEDEGLWRCVQWIKANYGQYRKKLMANNTAIREVVNIEDVEKAIQSAEAPVSRMAGGCYAWAIAIKRVLLPEGHLVAAVNKAVFDDSLSLVGHAAVVVGDPESEGSTWFDSEGRTNRENVESWGMLDPSEGEWEHYDRPGSLEDWIEKAAYESELLVFDNEDELLEYLPEEVKRQADRVEKALRSIK